MPLVLVFRVFLFVCSLLFDVPPHFCFPLSCFRVPFFLFTGFSRCSFYVFRFRILRVFVLSCFRLPFFLFTSFSGCSFSVFRFSFGGRASVDLNSAVLGLR